MVSEPTDLSLFLPYPPTLNNLFVNAPGRGRVASPEYRAWQLVAGLKINRQRPTPVPGKVRVTYEFRKPDNIRRDLGNLEKAASDLLVKQGVIEDDCLIEEITLRWVRDVPWEARVTVRAA